jgi:hypothetical protein
MKPNSLANCAISAQSSSHAKSLGTMACFSREKQAPCQMSNNPLSFHLGFRFTPE